MKAQEDVLTEQLNPEDKEKVMKSYLFNSQAQTVIIVDKQPLIELTPLLVPQAAVPQRNKMN